MPSQTWPELLGYQHEVLHTGVLRHLLHDPRRRTAVASDLIGKSITRVGEVWTDASFRVHNVPLTWLSSFG